MAIDTDLEWNGDKEKSDMNDAMIRFLVRGTNLVQGTAKTLVAVDTGDLRGTIVKFVEDNTLSGTVSTNSDHSKEQEFGKRSQPNYTFNPYMRPALDDNIPKLMAIAKTEGVKSVN